MDKMLEAAKVVASARRARTPLQPLDPAIAPRDEAEGYRIQDAVHALLAAEAGPLAGYKIGCTSQVMQRYLGIPHPCAGGVFAKSVHASGVSLRHSDYVRVGVECEIAVRLADDLVTTGAAFTADNVTDAINSYHPAIEIVDDRYADWRTIGAPTLVADDFFAAGCVLGAAVPRMAAPDLLDVTGMALINGVEVGRGSGSDVLGHPHAALAWLANHLAAQHNSLRAGQVVLTGSLVQTAWLKTGDRVAMQLSGLGTVAAEFV
jgi:2-keto-4-pentenoate hydratase